MPVLASAAVNSSLRRRSVGAALAGSIVTTLGAARAETAASPPAHDVATEVFEAGVSIGLVGRRFTYTDPVSINIRDYAVFGAPAPGLSIALYPAARTRLPFFRDLGLVGAASHAFGLSSETSSGTSVGTSYERLDLGLRERFRPGPPGLVLGITGGFALARFSYDATGNLAAQVPSVSYDDLRVAGDVRLPAGPAFVIIDVGYDGPLAAGAVHDRFRGATVGGVDASLGVAVPFARAFEARLSATYTRYFYTFHPTPGDVFVAGGALDEFFGITLGGVYAY
jgi:hypothetical protein